MAKTNMKRNYIMKRGACLALPLLSLLSLLIGMAQCKDDKEEFTGTPYDPNLPITVTSYAPDSGGAATQLLIYGSNFGTDKEQIQVTIGNKRAVVVSTNGSIIYALVPRQVLEVEGDCTVKLRVGELAEQEVGTFHYAPHYVVSTLAGFTDVDGKTAIVDGKLDIAQFEDPFWLAFDGDKNVYLIEERNGLRFINLDEGTVTTKFRTGNGVERPRTIEFTQNYDTMIIACDAGAWEDVSQIMLTGNFERWTAVHYSRQCNGGAFHPVNRGEYYFNSYEHGQVYKADRSTSLWGRKELFRTGDTEWEFNIQFAPSGNFAYTVVKNRHYIGKANYNWGTNVLEAPQDFAGGRSQGGYADGLGLSARFRDPHQGAFDENDNFYICDAMNHCIRKITPDGIVTTFAGRPEQSGYVDGELREAQFNTPLGIIYDQEERLFYIADWGNHRVRTISFE